MIKHIIFILSLLPLCLHFPYLLQAWTSSRLDRFDWIFYIFGAAAAIYAAYKAKNDKCDYYALFLLLPMLFLTFSYPIHKINALSIASANGVIFAAIWLLYSWKSACKMLPAFVILLTGTPSSSYQLSLLLMCPVWMAWAAKFLLALLCGGWLYCSKRFDLFVTKGNLFFSAAVIVSCFLLLHTKELYFEGKSFIPVFTSHIGDFWGRSILPDNNTKRFFATSKVCQYRYTKNNTDISVLAVQCGNNIHEIHPASHCLRTSQWTVLAEKILYLQDNFAVTEINAEKGANNILVWVWYSSEKFSTPGFLGFRRHFNPNGNYYTYQISVPVYDDIEKSRSALNQFIELLKKGGNNDKI